MMIKQTSQSISQVISNASPANGDHIADSDPLLREQDQFVVYRDNKSIHRTTSHSSNVDILKLTIRPWEKQSSVSKVSLVGSQPVPEKEVRGGHFIHRCSPPAKLDTITLEGETYFKAYKVVTTDLNSLGLKGNTNILHYTPRSWNYLPDSWLQAGPQDWGGVQLTPKLSGARAMQRYMLKKHGLHTCILECAIDAVLFQNGNMIKTNALFPVNVVAVS